MPTRSKNDGDKASGGKRSIPSKGEDGDGEADGREQKTKDGSREPRRDGGRSKGELDDGEPMDEDEEGELEDDDGMGDMAAMMGFGGFGSTKGKKVAGNNVGAISKEKKTEYRQYMNRVGGFNRPLSPGR